MVAHSVLLGPCGGGLRILSDAHGCRKRQLKKKKMEQTLPVHLASKLK